MEIQEILQDLQCSIDALQLKLNLLKTVETGQMYDVDLLLTRKEAASFLGRSTRQLDRLSEQGKLPRVNTDDGIRYLKSTLQAFMGLVITPLKIPKVEITTPPKSSNEFDHCFNKYL